MQVHLGTKGLACCIQSVKHDMIPGISLLVWHAELSGVKSLEDVVQHAAATMLST